MIQSLSFLSPFSLVSPQNPLTRKVKWLKACCFDDCHEILLVRNVRRLATSSHPTSNQLYVCVTVCVRFDEKEKVVNSSCRVLPATDICCCCCVMRLKLDGRIKCKWPIYLFLNYDYPSQLLFSENLESRKRCWGKPARQCIALKKTPRTLGHLNGWEIWKKYNSV